MLNIMNRSLEKCIFSLGPFLFTNILWRVIVKIRETTISFLKVTICVTICEKSVKIMIEKSLWINRWKTQKLFSESLRKLI